MGISIVPSPSPYLCTAFDNSLLKVIEGLNLVVRGKKSLSDSMVRIDLVSCGRVILAIIFSDKTREIGYAGIHYERVSTPSVWSAEVRN